MKMQNGNTLPHANTFNAGVKSITGRFDSYQTYAEYAVYHYAKHNNVDPLKRLFAAFVGVSGKLIGDGKPFAAYVNRYCYGFRIEADGSVAEEKKKNGKPKPRGFKALNDQNDLTWKAGSVDAGMVDTFAQFQKAQAAKQAEARKTAEAKQAEAEAAAEAAKETKAEAKQAEAEANGENETETEASAPDFTRATDVAEALRTIRQAFATSQSADIEALLEAKAEADKLAEAIAKRMEAARVDEADLANAEAETETEAAEA